MPQIRRQRYNEEWRFSVVDVVGILTGSVDGRTYRKVLKFRLKQEGSEVVTNCNQLKMLASDRKSRLTDALSSSYEHKQNITIIRPHRR
jgi:hypothetical protein